jgi:glycosyltransferase involved in cell wall biosynthesis
VPGVAENVPRRDADGGLVVPPGDAAALATALRRLIDEPGLAERLGNVVRLRVEHEYSLQAIGPQLKRFLLADAH